jgi:catalase
LKCQPAHAEDDDFVQPGHLVHNVPDDAARDWLVGNTVAQLRNGVTEPVLPRASGYLRYADQNLGDRVQKGVRAARPDRPPCRQGARYQIIQCRLTTQSRRKASANG